MGLLDDAIREHLELKRRRGADPAEVEKQEREALGPVRGGSAAAPAADEPVAEELAAEPAAAAAAPEPEAREPEPDLDLPPRALDPEPRSFEREPPPPPDQPVAAAPPPPAQPTEQYSVEDLEELRRDEPAEDVVPADEDPEAEDVLDETPDFLQEAPEHDRLWFEQRPPRDFDF
ncbi:MAG TPA: hypothetical protein VHF89_05035 [Solirubrobacteraceae bacterium]|nr:hypothetical protein [Solirubrobacteraceae bacterium]